MCDWSRTSYLSCVHEYGKKSMRLAVRSAKAVDARLVVILFWLCLLVTTGLRMSRRSFELDYKSHFNCGLSVTSRMSSVQHRSEHTHFTDLSWHKNMKNVAKFYIDTEKSRQVKNATPFEDRRTSQGRRRVAVEQGETFLQTGCCVRLRQNALPTGAGAARSFLSRNLGQEGTRDGRCDEAQRRCLPPWITLKRMSKRPKRIHGMPSIPRRNAKRGSPHHFKTAKPRNRAWC